MIPEDGKNIYSRSESNSQLNTFFQTTANIRDLTNNIKTFADNLEQLINSVENFAPTIEKVAQSTNLLRSRLAGKTPQE